VKNRERMPFGKRRKKPEISSPTNFEHRVHTGFDSSQGVFIGLPSQWNSILSIQTKDKNRPKPIVDPSNITSIDLVNIKVAQNILNDQELLLIYYSFRR